MGFLIFQPKMMCALAATMTFSGLACALTEQVEFSGAKGEGYAYVEKVTATLQIPEHATKPMPAVAIFHGSSGIDGRGAFHAEALNKAGIATLEVFMFNRGQRLKAGHEATLTHAFGALQYLSSRADIDPQKIGITGYSWGGNVTLKAASKAVHKAFFPQGGPVFSAHAPYYAIWWVHLKSLRSADTAHVYSELTGAPVLLVAGGKDDYGDANAAQQLIDALPASARPLVSLLYYADATHGFDSPAGSDRTITDEVAANGKGGRVRFYRNESAAEDARAKTVAFFLKAFGM